MLIQNQLNNSILDLLVANLTRLTETEDTDRQGVFQVLGTFENLLSFMPPLANQIVSDTTLFPWLLKRVSQKEYDSNKQYASEILAILLQESRENVLRLAELEGMEVMLKVLSVGIDLSQCLVLVLDKNILMQDPAISKEGPGRRRRSRIHGEHLQLPLLGTGRARDEAAFPGFRRGGAHDHHDEVGYASSVVLLS